MNKKIVFLPYDFDTALGINNEGSLVFGYNLEDIDQTAGGEDVFNGQQSVLWKNLRETYGDEIKEMYKTLRSTGKLSYPLVEQAFENHQEKWSEAIFNEDAWFKYLAPLKEKGSAAYLSMLQGSKAEQRKWWLYNRFKYIDSKYNAGDSLTDVITLRGYAKSNISVTPYADIYATIKYGSYLVQTRAARGQSYTLTCPLDNVNDTEIYIYSASQLASVGDLSGLKVGYAEFVYATKLQELKLGDNTIGYTNGNLLTLYLGNNKLLKKLDVRNCTNFGSGSQKSVDLSGCTAIEEVYFDGTQIAGVSLPNGGMLKKLHLPSTITSLIIRNHSGITEFVCNNYSNITTLWLENPSSAIDTLDIVEDMPTGGRVRLFNFHWELEDLDDVEDMFDKLDTMRGLDQSGNNTESAQVYGSIHVEQALGSQYGSICARYPDVTITYDHITSYLYYYNYDGSQLLYTEEITDAADGEYSGAPTKTATVSTVYTFAGWSRTAGGAADSTATENVTADRNVYAAYTERVREYTITFVLAEVDGGTTLQTSSVGYGSTPVYSGATPESSNDDGGEYEFSGWTPSIAAVTGDATYTATFADVRPIIVYMVEGVAFDAEYVSTGGDGEGPSETPTKESTVQTSYTFAGWNTSSSADTADPDALKNVTANRTVYAVFTATTREYAISFVRAAADGGGTLQTSNVAYGSLPSYTGSTPTSTRTDGIWQFAGWSPAIDSVTGAATYTAVFENVGVKITYMFNDAQYYEEWIVSGNNASGPSTNPSIAQTAQYTYTFLGWNSNENAETADANALSGVSNDTVLYAIFSAVVRTYTITFVKAAEDGGGTLQTLSNVAYGTVPLYTGGTPTTTKENYSFTGWNPSITAVTGNATYTAVFEEVPQLTRSTINKTISTVNHSAITNVRKYAFYNCGSLISVSLPAVISISNSAFAYCSKLTTISFPSATTLGSYVFQGCGQILTVSFPYATEVGMYTFANCRSLTTAIFPAATQIGTYAFQYCYELSNISFPSVTSIWSYAFINCSSLTTVYFPSATFIGAYAFSNCYSLTTASFPYATEIENFAFASCSALSIVSLPVVRTIGTYAFNNCKSLSTLSLPSVTTIKSEAFLNCDSLISIILASTSMAIITASNILNNAPNAIIYVNDTLVETYKQASYWSYYSSRIKGISEL